jgi:cytochrome c
MAQALNITKFGAAAAFALFLPIAPCGPRSGHKAGIHNDDDRRQGPHQMMRPGLMVPKMDAAKGRKLFAAKGCVVCHSVNGVGGTDAAALDASTMTPMMNPFDFTAQMWRGAEAMIEMQREELGAQVEFTGQELADIIAFTHDADEQKKFSDVDIPPEIRKLMRSEDDDGHSDHGDHEMKQGGQMMKGMKQ